MKDLEPELKEKVVLLCEKGMEQAEIERYEASNRTFSKVYALLPEPKPEWKAYTWLVASIADNHFELKEYDKAMPYFNEAVELDEAYKVNAFVQMRVGQCLLELGKSVEAEAQLKLALDMGGEEIFEDEYVKYKKLAQKV